ncbi:hypothetical protein VKT23_004970 [Stygiomarasmius scandens]|uniref:Mid2 domain-containing protein n=1 Tax=Marasmiellus scandens TaxID=2682957 RepID=A0ABR1JSL8_9AGAR
MLPTILNAMDYNAVLVNAAVNGSNNYGDAWTEPQSGSSNTGQTSALTILINALAMNVTDTEPVSSVTATPQPAPGPNNQKENNIGLIIGCVMGSLGFVAVMLLVLLYYYKNHKRHHVSPQVLPPVFPIPCSIDLPKSEKSKLQESRTIHRLKAGNSAISPQARRGQQNSLTGGRQENGHSLPAYHAQ